jgi:hypothetical protein
MCSTTGPFGSILHGALCAWNVPGHEFGMLARIDHNGAAVSQYAPHLLGADFRRFLIWFGERRLEER